MKYPGFIGATYTGKANHANGDRCQNWYPESTKGAGASENDYVFLTTPGKKLFTTIPVNGVLGIYVEPATARVFCVAVAGKLYEVDRFGTVTLRGGLGAGPYSFASNGLQMMIACAGNKAGFIFTLSTNVLTAISSSGFLGCSDVNMIDNYFICRVPNSRKFQVSTPLDGTTWDATMAALSEGGPDNLVGAIDNHNELWLFGSERAQIYEDTGGAGNGGQFPFEPIQSIFIEQGLAATKSLIKVDNTVYWLGQDRNGWARVFRADGYTPVGVSNRSIEYFFNQYAKSGNIADAVAYSYQNESGHTFYVISFPSANADFGADGRMVSGVIRGATWVYDITEGMWHERPYNDPNTGQRCVGLDRYHAFVFGKHLVCGGDATGNIYDMSEDYYTDNGAKIRRRRVAPHINDEGKVIAYNALRLNCQTGFVDPTDADRYAVLRMSRDGGATYGGDISQDLGAMGDYNKLVEWRCLGRSTRAAFEVTTTVNGPITLTDAYLRITEGR